MRNTYPTIDTFSVTFECPRSKKAVCVSVSFSHMTTSISSCEMCGEHGQTEVFVECPECGKTHTIILKEW